MKVDSIRANNDFLITLLERNPHGLTFKEIAREWQRANMNGDNKPLTISTFKRRLTDIQSICQVKYVNRVYKIISSHIPDTNRLREWGISIQAIKAKLRDCEDLSNRILLEPLPSGDDYLEHIILAMKDFNVINIVYREYGKLSPDEITLEPYCLKTYHNRWYLLGRCQDDRFRIYCLDRIEYVGITTNKFIIPSTFNEDQYFSEFYTVRLDSDVPIQRVILRAHENERFILDRQPIHTSQKLRSKGENYYDFEYRIRPTFDFVSYLESQGRFIEVLEPIELRKELLRVHREAIEQNKITEL